MGTTVSKSQKRIKSSDAENIIINASCKLDVINPPIIINFSFLDFMEKWNQDGRPIFMDVAWTTEKSIQDELDRTSKAEVITVVISYLVMFVYVAIALGRIKASVVGCLVSLIITIAQNYKTHYE